MKISDALKRVRTWFKGLAGSALVSLFIDVNPVPASRPRVTRWGVYYGKNYAAWRKEASTKIESFPDVPMDGPIAALVECVVEKPKTSKLEFPRGDVDNYAKGPLDLINDSQKLWHDDNQVVLLVVTKRFAEPGEEPGTKVHLFPVSEVEK